jgi:hypothetical protein
MDDDINLKSPVGVHRDRDNRRELYRLRSDGIRWINPKIWVRHEDAGKIPS